MIKKILFFIQLTLLGFSAGFKEIHQEIRETAQGLEETHQELYDPILMECIKSLEESFIYHLNRDLKVAAMVIISKIYDEILGVELDHKVIDTFLGPYVNYNAGLLAIANNYCFSNAKDYLIKEKPENIHLINLLEEIREKYDLTISWRQTKQERLCNLYTAENYEGCAKILGDIYLNGIRSAEFNHNDQKTIEKLYSYKDPFEQGFKKSLQAFKESFNPVSDREANLANLKEALKKLNSEFKKELFMHDPKDLELRKRVQKKIIETEQKNREAIDNIKSSGNLYLLFKDYLCRHFTMDQKLVSI